VTTVTSADDKLEGQKANKVANKTDDNGQKASWLCVCASVSALRGLISLDLRH
jgi:hypothetical protein